MKKKLKIYCILMEERAKVRILATHHDIEIREDDVHRMKMGWLKIKSAFVVLCDHRNTFTTEGKNL